MRWFAENNNIIKSASLQKYLKCKNFEMINMSTVHYLNIDYTSIYFHSLTEEKSNYSVFLNFSVFIFLSIKLLVEQNFSDSAIACPAHILTDNALLCGRAFLKIYVP